MQELSWHDQPYFFTLAALSGKDKAYAEKAIQKLGGRCFSRHTIELVTSKERAFAICPPSLPSSLETKLVASLPDFALGEALLYLLCLAQGCAS